MGKEGAFPYWPLVRQSSVGAEYLINATVIISLRVETNRPAADAARRRKSWGDVSLQQTSEVKMSNGASGYTPFIQLLDEIGRARDAGAIVAALAMVYVGIDTMAMLSCPVGQQSSPSISFG